MTQARWGFAEDTLALQAVLHDAVKTHGCPVGLYADNGSAYSSGNLAWSLAVLDIKIVHSRRGRPQGRGKIEKWNQTCRTEFLVEIETGRGTGGTSVSSLAELNLMHPRDDAPRLIDPSHDLGAAEDERAAVGRVGDEVVHRRVGRLGPPDHT